MSEELQPAGPPEPQRDEGERAVLILVVMALLMFVIGLTILYFAGGKLGVMEIARRIWTAVIGNGGGQ